MKAAWRPWQQHENNMKSALKQHESNTKVKWKHHESNMKAWKQERKQHESNMKASWKKKDHSSKKGSNTKAKRYESSIRTPWKYQRKQHEKVLSIRRNPQNASKFVYIYTNWCKLQNDFDGFLRYFDASLGYRLWITLSKPAFVKWNHFYIAFLKSVKN